jgi:uncharacterized protein (TIGR00730 family)
MTTELKSIAVFCGSSAGSDPIYKKQAFALGELLAKHSISIVYGGANIGLMGAVADGALSEGGKVTGVIPGFLKAHEIAHQELSELIEVESMHERKLKMNELCDGVIALPGGYGTFEELFEMITWAQLGLHHKPIGLLNINGYYDPLLQMVDRMLHEGFLKKINADMLLHSSDGPMLLQQMQDYASPLSDKWIADNQT